MAHVAQITGFDLIETGERSRMSNFSTEHSNQQADEFTEPSAGPVPTASEAAAADRCVVTSTPIASASTTPI